MELLQGCERCAELGRVCFAEESFWVDLGADTQILCPEDRQWRRAVHAHLRNVGWDGSTVMQSIHM